MKPQASGLRRCPYRNSADRCRKPWRWVPTVVVGNTQPIQMRVEELISGARDAGPQDFTARTWPNSTAWARKQGRAEQCAWRRRPVAGSQQGQAADGHQGQPRGRGALRDQRRRDPGDGAGRHRRRGGVSTLIDGVRALRHRRCGSMAFRDSPQAIGNIPIRTSSGAMVPLSRVATVEMTRAIPSCAASNCSAMRCCRWTCRAATWTASSGGGRENPEGEAARPATGSNGAAPSRTSSGRWRGWR
jgi:cobalt-zinc-cadmium resistance protein CzcA